MEILQEHESMAAEIGTAVRHTAVYGLGNVLAKGLGFFMLPLYTHYLNPADYGILEILDLSMSLFGMFLSMGLIAALLRCYTSAQSAEQKRKVVSTAFLFVLVTGIVTFLIGLHFLRPVCAMILGPKVPPVYLLLAFTSFILGYITNVPRTYLRAINASGTFVTIDTLTLVCLLGLNVLFIAVLKIGLVGILLSSLVVFSLQVILLSAWMVRRVGLGYNAAALRYMLVFGAPLMFSNIATFALNFSDRFFLQHLRSLEVVGIYAVGYKFGFMLNYLLVQSFYLMWQSRMYAIHGRPDHREIFRQIFVLYSLVLTYAGLALSVFSPEIVHVMVGPEFSASYDVIPLIALAYIFCGIGDYAQLGMFVTDNTKLIGGIGACAAVLNLLLNYFLILHFGMLGAAWATLLSFVAIAIASYWFSERVYPLPLGVARIAIILTLGVSLYLPFRWWAPSSPAIALFAKGFALLVFPVLVWSFRILSPPEIATIVFARDYTVQRLARLARCIPSVS